MPSLDEHSSADEPQPWRDRHGTGGCVTSSRFGCALAGEVTARRSRQPVRVHGYVQSINVRKVLWCCAELQLDAQLVERGTETCPVSDASFRNMSPMGLVPVIEDGAIVLSQSNSIIRYLARREKREDLMPVALAAAAEVDRWLDWQATDLNDSWRYSFMALHRASERHRDKDEIARSLKAFTSMMVLADRQLVSTGAFIAGQQFTIADIAFGLSLRRWWSMNIAGRTMRGLDAYYQRLCKRPAFVPFGGPNSPA